MGRFTSKPQRVAATCALKGRSLPQAACREPEGTTPGGGMPEGPTEPEGKEPEGKEPEGREPKGGTPAGPGNA